ncbi:Alpha/Beta hydrolase fold [Rhypophila decipiens]
MEKEALGHVVAEPCPRLLHPRRRHASRPYRLVAAALVVLATICYFVPRPNWYWDLYYWLSDKPRYIGISVDNIWDSITPSTNLEWHDCYRNIPGSGDLSFKCARLTVPLDYSKDVNDLGGSDNKVHLALVLRPARNGSSASSKPPMLINPGGPGGSGTAVTLYMGSAIQAVFGDDQPVLGFDPRGIGYTTPLADCWAMPPPSSCTGDHSECPEDAGKGFQHRMEWMKQNGAYGFINTSDISLKYLDAGHRAVNKLCTARDGRHGGKSILRHASTAHVARDMLSIVDAWDRWVDGDFIKQREESEKSKLTYWGFSYGTYLGIKFASMFPDRVGRLMLDGVVDADYYESPVWAESLLDTDKILDLFFESCAGAGSRCALYREGDTPESVSERYHAVIDRLQYGEPVSFTHPDYFYPVVLTSELFRVMIFSFLYSPMQAFSGMAFMLDDLYEERYERFGLMFGDLAQMCLVDPGSLVMVLNDAQRAIMCSDKSAPLVTDDKKVNQSPAEIKSSWETMATKSQFADVWMSIMMECNGWDLFEKDPLALSNAQGGAEDKIPKMNTSFPILFLSNTLDPVTPLKAAVKMALRFEGAGLLEQKSAGHCTNAAASRCTAKVLRGYINHGKVPPPPKFPKGSDGGDDDEYLLKGEWTTCEADEGPFGTLDEDDVAAMEEDDRRLLEALLTIQGVLKDVPKWEIQKRPVI